MPLASGWRIQILRKNFVLCPLLWRRILGLTQPQSIACEPIPCKETTIYSFNKHGTLDCCQNVWHLPMPSPKAFKVSIQQLTLIYDFQTQHDVSISIRRDWHTWLTLSSEYASNGTLLHISMRKLSRSYSSLPGLTPFLKSNGPCSLKVGWVGLLSCFLRV